MSLKNILIFINSDWFFLLHRVAITNVLKTKGFNVIVATVNTGKKQEIIDLGYGFIEFSISRKGVNPLIEVNTLLKTYKLYKRINPDLVYQVTIKPIIYGSIVSRILKINTVNTICGLGYVFSKNKNSLLRKMVSFAYRYSINYKKTHVFFENGDDQNTFLELGILKQRAKSTVVNGVGVDLNKFKPQENLNNNKKIVVSMPTRMLWDKGVGEFVEAAKLLELNFKQKIEFRLYGMIDKGNPESISEDYLNNIEIKDYLKWFGFKDNMINVYMESDIVVLPSYREGLPTVLAEACAIGLPIVTTDAVGCKECVEEGVNGFKVPVKSIKELAEAIEKLILDKDLRMQMGVASRKKAERDFDQNKIIAEYEKVFKSMLIN